MSSNFKNIKVAVVGAGAWGKNLVRNFNEQGALKIICDTNEEILEIHRTQYPDLHFTTSYKEVLDNHDIEGIVIATPAETHYTLAKDALLAGKNVYVEKPLSLKLEEAKELIHLSENSKLILMVGHILRYHPAVDELKKLIELGELGKIQYIYSNRLNIGKIRTEENILWSFAPHDISVILFLLDEKPESVSATGGNYLQEGIADVTLTTIDFSGGVKTHIFVSWLHPFKEQKLVVVGDKKMAVFDDLTEKKLFLYPHKIKWENSIPVACKAGVEVVSVRMTEPLKRECKHFLVCIKNQVIPATDGYEGLRVLEVLNAAQDSMNMGGLKVPIYVSTKVISPIEAKYIE